MDSTPHTSHSTLYTPRSTAPFTLHLTHPSHFTYKLKSFLSRKGIAVLRIPANQNGKFGLLNSFAALLIFAVSFKFDSEQVGNRMRLGLAVFEKEN